VNVGVVNLKFLLARLKSLYITRIDSPVGEVFTFRGSDSVTTMSLTAMEPLLVLSISVVKMAMKQSTHICTIAKFI
jgi:hypothetical protein